MLKSVFKIVAKVLAALGGVVLALAVVRYMQDQKNDYIEIYNYDEEEEELI